MPAQAFHNVHTEVACAQLNADHIRILHFILEQLCKLSGVGVAGIRKMLQSSAMGVIIAGVSVFGTIGQKVKDVLRAQAVHCQLGQIPAVMFCHLYRVGIGHLLQEAPNIDSLPVVTIQAVTVGERVAQRYILQLVNSPRSCNKRNSRNHADHHA